MYFMYSYAIAATLMPWWPTERRITISESYTAMLSSTVTENMVTNMGTSRYHSCLKIIMHPFPDALTSHTWGSVPLPAICKERGI